VKREDPFVAHCAELLSAVAPIRARAMFGGWGLYAGDAMLALVAGDELFLKVDGGTRARFVAAGCEPFVWDGPRGPVTFSFFRPPPGALEAPDAMEPWARLALEAARRSRAARATAARRASAASVARPASRRPRRAPHAKR
jgi:DNA transformation protein